MSESLWRYMDYSKFMQLISSGALYFCGVRKFDDPFEGQYAWGEKGERKFIDTQKKLHLTHGAGGSMDFNLFLAMNLKTLNDLSRFTYVNCWHQSEHESEAMWRLYCQNPKEGVLIRTTVDKLRKSLATVKHRKLQLKPVKYVKNYWIKNYNPEADVYFHKRISFEHEREFRAVIQDAPWEGNPVEKHGELIPVELGELIQEVRTSPLSNDTFQDLVKRSLESHLPGKNVERSEIDVQPKLSIEEQRMPNEQGYEQYAIRLLGKYA